MQNTIYTFFTFYMVSKMFRGLRDSLSPIVCSLLRTALVRANYSNIPKGIEETTEYLERFFRNALMGEENKLQSRFLLVGAWKGDSTPTSKDGTPTSKSSAPTSNTVIPPASKALALSRAVRLLLDVLEAIA